MIMRRDIEIQGGMAITISIVATQAITVYCMMTCCYNNESILIIIMIII